MKINKYFLGLATLVMGAFMASCDTDVEGVTYTPMGQSVSFETSKPAPVTTSGTSLSVPVRIIRADTRTAYTASYTATASEDGIFSDSGNGSVSFAAGQGVAEITVNANNMKGGTEYTYTLELSAADQAAGDTITKSQIVKTVITVRTEYNWVAAGTCTFVDYTFEEEGAAANNVPIQNAQGTNLYRIVQPWKAVYGANEFSTDSGVQFTLNADNSITLETDANGIVATVDEYDFVWVEQYVPDYCYVEQAGNVFEIGMLGLVGGEGYYTGFAFSFKWDGWPGN